MVFDPYVSDPSKQYLQPSILVLSHLAAELEQLQL